MEVQGFAPADLYALALQAQQLGMQIDLDDPSYGAALAKAGPCFTATHNGDVIACIGVLTQWPNYGKAWALLSENAGPCMLALTRGVRRWLRFHNPGRIDTAVDCGFPAAIRWAEMLGFTNETPDGMKGYTPERRTCFLYAQTV